MDTLAFVVYGVVGALNGINGMGLGALALVVALVIVWKK
jgi:hypothetical protein